MNPWLFWVPVALGCAFIVWHTVSVLREERAKRRRDRREFLRQREREQRARQLRSDELSRIIR